MNRELEAKLAEILRRVEGVRAPQETKDNLKKFISDTFEEIDKEYGYDWLYEVWADDALSYKLQPE